MRDMFGLGERESTIMEVLWSAAEPVTVRDVLDRLERPLAYTTVMTVLDNLHNKGHVTREKVGRAFRYRAAQTREAAAAQMVREVLAASGDAEGVLLHFAGSASPEEFTVLRRILRRGGLT
ncbi:BlaI/MecI/CopY family transcriptional regulator [Mycobacteroides chelonae]|nr:BlaI/MecI/CopY family transcriptional regulator [Mycobacteroides chelonae]